MFISLVNILVCALLVALSLIVASTRMRDANQVTAQQPEPAKPIVKTHPGSTNADVMKALNLPMSVDFRGTDVRKLIEEIDKKTGGKLNLVLDEPDEPGYERKIKQFRMNRAAVRTILRKVLNDSDLAYYLEDGSLRITDKERAAGQTVIKFYPISDRVGGSKAMGPNSMSHIKANAQALALLIMNTTEPDYWEPTGGGPGKFDWDPKTLGFVVRASVEMHLKLQERGLVSVDWKDLVAVPDRRVLKVYDISGILDPKSLESGKSALLQALSLIIPDEEWLCPAKYVPVNAFGEEIPALRPSSMDSYQWKCGCDTWANTAKAIARVFNVERPSASYSATILTHTERLVVFTIPEAHANVERLIADLKVPRK